MPCEDITSTSSRSVRSYGDQPFVHYMEDRTCRARLGTTIESYIQDDLIQCPLHLVLRVPIAHSSL